MTDTERIVDALIGNMSSPEKAEALAKLFQEMVTAYEKGASKAVAALLQQKVTPLNTSFDAAYLKLQERMGL